MFPPDSGCAFSVPPPILRRGGLDRPLFFFRLTLLLDSSEQGKGEEHQEDNEQDLGRHGGGQSLAGEAVHAGDNGQDDKNKWS